METGFDLGNIYVIVEIDYKVWPGEPEVRYYPDGSGHPGTPDEIEILDVHVTSVSGENYNLDSVELHEMGWAEDMNRLATQHVENSGEISEAIFELENERVNDC